MRTEINPSYGDDVADRTPTVAELHAELDRVRADFHEMVATASPEALRRTSDGTKWTNRQLLFHMLFGYLITRNLRWIVKLVSRGPVRVQRGFSRLLDASTPLFHRVNYWGSCAGASVITPGRADAWLGRVVRSMHRHLDHETESALERTMYFPTRWDPYFRDQMSLRDVYHYAAQHYEHHRNQLTLGS